MDGIDDEDDVALLIAWLTAGNKKKNTTAETIVAIETIKSVNEYHFLPTPFKRMISNGKDTTAATMAAMPSIML